jgi:hypothetical protein
VRQCSALPLAPNPDNNCSCATQCYHYLCLVGSRCRSIWKPLSSFPVCLYAFFQNLAKFQPPYLTSISISIISWQMPALQPRARRIHYLLSTITYLQLLHHPHPASALHPALHSLPVASNLSSTTLSPPSPPPHHLRSNHSSLRTHPHPRYPTPTRHSRFRFSGRKHLH